MRPKPLKDVQNTKESRFLGVNTEQAIKKTCVGMVYGRCLLMNGTCECTVSNLRIRRDEVEREILRHHQHHPLPQRIFAAGGVVVDRKIRRHLAAASIHSGANFSEIRSVVDAVMRDGP